MKLQDKKDKNFTYATDVKEEALITGKEPFTHPKFSPDGKKIAFLANRTEIRVYDVKSKRIDVALPAKFNFSYADGDMGFEWSPDSRWILTSYMGEGGWNNMDIAVASIDGKKVVNLTNSGYSDESPEWALGGKAIVWASDRAGYRSHGSWGAEDDVYIMYLDKEAYELSKYNKEDRALYEERMKAAKDSTDKSSKAGKQKSKTDKKKKADGKDKSGASKDEKSPKKD
ncbi:MAG TPA: peptidase S41, partial [Prevotellaceae bacterium]|nr:peptidase S41 [Prevotellaceae bacterium]